MNDFEKKYQKDVKPLIPVRVDNKLEPEKPKDIKLIIRSDPSLKDMIVVTVADNTKAIQTFGESVIVYSGKLEGYWKYICMAFGYGIKYAGKFLDSKITRVEDLKK